MKVFISGANGALGLAMQNLLRRENVNFLAADIEQVDITDFKKTNSALLNYRPDVILHFAAVSDVDTCEESRDQAFRTNALGTLGLALIAKKIGAKILYTSTNYVFDGNSEEPYTEYSNPHPVNEYGKTKLLGEEYIQDLCDRYYIVRTSWLFGKHCKTFISKFLLAKNKPRSIDVICDQFASFTFIPDLAEMIFLLIKSENYGIFHCTNKGYGCWLDFVLRAKELMKFSAEINSVKTEELNLPAPRPTFTPLASNHIGFLFGKSMRTWELALGEFIASFAKN